MELHFATINWMAVAASAVATFFLGAVWYTALFGRAWREAHGYSEEQMKRMQARRPMPVFFGMMLVAYIVLAVVVALLADLVGARSAAAGATLGALLWLGPAAGIGVTEHISSDRPWRAYWIDRSFQLIYLVMMGVILAAWR